MVVGAGAQNSYLAHTQCIPGTHKAHILETGKVVVIIENIKNVP